MTLRTSRFRWLLVGLLLLSISAAHAEGNCPPGYYPIGAAQGQSGPQGCAPIPGYNDQQQTQPQPPPPQWKDNWGAIATDGPGGSFGASADMPDRSSAENKALADCHSKRGATCAIETWYSNGCAAMVIGDNSHISNNASTLNEAIQMGMKKCNATDANCHVYYSDCSLPVRIQ